MAAPDLARSAPQAPGDWKAALLRRQVPPWQDRLGTYNYPGIEEQAGRFKTVDDIVREPAHGYLAAIGGDVHNYQRYSVLVNDTGPASDEVPPGTRARLRARTPRRSC